MGESYFSCWDSRYSCPFCGGWRGAREDSFTPKRKLQKLNKNAVKSLVVDKRVSYFFSAL
jgi:hypothetical protein